MFRSPVLALSFLSSSDRLRFFLLLGARVVAHAFDVLGLAAVGLIGAMVAGGLNQRPEAEFFGLTISLQSSSAYLLVVSAIAAFFLGKSILAVFLVRLTTLFLARVEADAAVELARYLFSGDLARVTSRSRGESQWLIQSSTEEAFSINLFAFASIVTETALFLAILAVFLVVDFSTALVLVGFFILVMGAYQFLVSQRLRRLGKTSARFARNLNNAVLDVSEAFREATVLEKKNWFLKKLDVNRRGLSRNKALEVFSLNVPRYLVEATLIIGILTLTAWQFGVSSEFEGLVVIGVFLAGGTRMMAALLPLQNAVNRLRVTGPKAARALDVLNRAREEPPEDEASALTGPMADLDFTGGIDVDLQGVSFKYPDGKVPALRGIDLHIQAGDFAALVGPSGAGKSTMADLLLGLYEPTTGSIRLGGHSPYALRKQFPGLISYVPQHPGMVSGSVAENVALGLGPSDIDEKRVEECLREAGLWTVVTDMSKGIHTSLGTYSDALSGGQIQRLGIARALYSRPRFMVLDEATSALDAETEAVIADSIERLRGSTTCVVIAHRLSTIQHADVVFVLEDGRLVAEGSFAEVRRRVPRIERYVQLMAIKD